MATIPEEPDAKVINRELRQALRHCQNLVAQTRLLLRQTHQDNEPE